MKKALLLLVLILTLSCSNDDSNDTKTQNQDVYMKVLLINEGIRDNAPFYQLHYGTSSNDRVELVITEQVYKFYQNRIQNKNDRWIGEVDHE